MATVQRQATLPPPSFLGRPERRQMPGQALPSIQSLQYPGPLPSSADAGPIRLPPLQSTKVSGVHQLLSQSSPPDAQVQPPYDRAPIHQQHGWTNGAPPLRAPKQNGPSYSYPAQPFATIPQNTYERHPGPPIQVPPHTSITSMSDRHSYSPAVSIDTSSQGYYSSGGVSPRSPTAQIGLSESRVSRPPPLKYTLSIRQQPAAARACGFGERDRRVIDPPPILELKITDLATGRPEQDHNGMLALHCTLMTPDGKHDDTECTSTSPEQPTQRRLMGTLVASPYQAKDEHGIAGTFFVFPDLSCRSPGKYRLRFKLLRIDPTAMARDVSFPSVDVITTDVFSVYTAKDFPGMRASSALLVSLRRQGLNVGVKKGSEARKGKGKTKKESGSSDEDDDDSEESEAERRGSGGTAVSGSTAGGVSPKTKSSGKKMKRKRRPS